MHGPAHFCELQGDAKVTEPFDRGARGAGHSDEGGCRHVDRVEFQVGESAGQVEAFEGADPQAGYIGREQELAQTVRPEGGDQDVPGLPPGFDRGLCPIETKSSRRLRHANAT